MRVDNCLRPFVHVYWRLISVSLRFSQGILFRSMRMVKVISSFVELFNLFLLMERILISFKVRELGYSGLIKQINRMFGSLANCILVI